MDAFKARLSYINMDSDPEFSDLVKKFQANIKEPFSMRVGWLSYRILDDILKKLFLKKVSDNFMPVDLKVLGMKMLPSNNILLMNPDNLFDTL
jgi:hypothetical protein